VFYMLKKVLCVLLAVCLLVGTAFAAPANPKVISEVDISQITLVPGQNLPAERGDVTITATGLDDAFIAGWSILKDPYNTTAMYPDDNTFVETSPVRAGYKYIAQINLYPEDDYSWASGDDLTIRYNGTALPARSGYAWESCYFVNTGWIAVYIVIETPGNSGGVPGIPETGDTESLVFYAAVALTAIMSCAVVLFRKKRNAN